MRNEVYYISEKPTQNNHAGNKARVDIDNILEHGKFIRYEIFNQFLENSKFKRILKILSYKNLNKLCNINNLNNKLLILQYPFYFDRITKYFLFKALKNNETILFLHDLDSLRNLSKKNIKQEIFDLNKAKYVIVHNKIMAEFLQSNGLKSKIVNLELFDYLLNVLPNRKSYTLGKNIVFAGNIAKSTFLSSNHISQIGLILNLYGPNFEESNINEDNIIYKGSYKPDVVPYKLEGNFGLIWDGDSIETCKGEYGNYLKYNNPHKLSLYIAAGLPVITWKQAAIAKFIEENKIGFTVNSLYEISSVIDNLDNKTYQEYIENIKMLQSKVCNGYFTQRVLNEVVDDLNKNEKTL